MPPSLGPIVRLLGSAALLICVLCGALSGPSSAQAVDPFAPRLRWSRASSANTPWQPRAVAFGARDNVVWAACPFGNPHFALFSSNDQGNAAPLGTMALDPSSSGLAVAAAKRAQSYFALWQEPDPTPTARRTHLWAFTFADGLVPRWTYDAGVLTNGPARIACDESGSTVLVALWLDGSGEVQLDALDAATGARRWRSRFHAANLSTLVCASSGARAVVAAGLSLTVVSASGAVLHQEVLPSATQAVDLSADGRSLVIGGIGRVRVAIDTGAGYATTFEALASANEIASRASLSADGSTLAVAWWHFGSGTSLRFEVWDVATSTRVFVHEQLGAAGALQNLPEVARVTADGRRAAFGAWGDGTTKPEVVVWERGSTQPKLAIDLPGSVFALAIDERGERLSVGVKHAHANVLANTGEIRLYDLGARDLVALSPPRVGGELRLAAKQAGARACHFLLGLESEVALPFPGIEGSLWLKRGRLVLHTAPCDSDGRAELTLPVPDDPVYSGVYRHVQAMFRTGDSFRFGMTVLHELVL
ncbi:MAG: hypothetical protein ACKVWV_07750 [Planctomycetota bacterium]